MPQCELCGSEVDELTKTKVSGAELSVCSNCTSHGTTVGSNSKNSTSTKYSTDSSGSSSDKSSSTPTKSTRSPSSGSSSSQSHDQSDPFDEMSDLAINYGEQIEAKRSQNGMSRKDLAQELGIKESHLRHIENQDTQPSVELQTKIEKKLGIDLGQNEDLGH